MAVTAALPGLPSGLGATIIQASTLLLPASEYVPIDWNVAQRIVDNSKLRANFSQFPGKLKNGQTNPDWAFYARSDMSGTSSPKKTLVGILARVIGGTKSVFNTTLNGPVVFPTKKVEYTVYVWHYVNVTLTSGSVYTDVQLSCVTATILYDPESGDILAPTSGYQAIHEALGLVIKPVAGTVPLFDPAYAGVSGQNPNV